MTQPLWETLKMPIMLRGSDLVGQASEKKGKRLDS